MEMNSNCCNSCNSCNKRNDCGTCGGCGGGCCPAKYNCSFNIEVSPYDPYTWLVTNCNMTHKVKIPKFPETCTYLQINPSDLTLMYHGECGDNIITGEQLGSIIKLDDLLDVDAPAPDSCSMLVFDPYCSSCGDGCTAIGAMWKPYHIPDAGDCVVEPDEDGYYKVLVKNDCGCIEECRIPVVPKNGIVVNYERDSVPDDPDFPWYYGNYNDRINLHLAENYEDFFGKYDLKVTINYGVQAIKSDRFNYNYNWRSLVVPVIEGDIVRTTQCASILQNWGASIVRGTGAGQVAGGLPWGSTSLRGSFTFIVPKGKEAYLHHEYRIRTNESSQTYSYHYTPADGRRVPDSEAKINSILYPASRLNALQVIVEPISGTNEYDPVTDAYRDQLDSPVDSYPQDI